MQHLPFGKGIFGTGEVQGAPQVQAFAQEQQVLCAGATAFGLAICVQVRPIKLSDDVSWGGLSKAVCQGPLQAVNGGQQPFKRQCDTVSLEGRLMTVTSDVGMISKDLTQH